MGDFNLSNSSALTKIQAIILIAIIAVAVVAAIALMDGQNQSSETIKIGICADLNGFNGKKILQGAKLAAEQVNAEGGVLGRKFEIVAEDDDSETSGNMEFATKTYTRLITVDGADFTISYTFALAYQEIASQHKKIFFTLYDASNEFTQGVLDNYEKYKYNFRTGVGNNTAAVEGISDTISVCRNYTGFNKVAFIYGFFLESLVSPIIERLEEYGFDVVLSEPVTSPLEFSSAFAKAEAAGAEIIYPFLLFEGGGIQFVKEYYDRQSPTVLWGHINLGSSNEFWEMTGGRCESITNSGYPVVAGYPLTTKTVPTKEAYFAEWGEEINNHAAAAYDTVRFILPDAIKRAGTIDTDAVIEALESTDIETSLCRRFVLTNSHDIMVGKEGPNRLSDDYFIVAMFQWQNGIQVPVYPVALKEEAGASYIFPDWSGPWDNIS